jgi:hypothetical protein
MLKTSQLISSPLSENIPYVPYHSYIKQCIGIKKIPIHNEK